MQVVCANRGLILQRSRRMLHRQTMAGTMLRVVDPYLGATPLPGYSHSTT